MTLGSLYDAGLAKGRKEAQAEIERLRDGIDSVLTSARNENPGLRLDGPIDLSMSAARVSLRSLQELWALLSVSETRTGDE